MGEELGKVQVWQDCQVEGESGDDIFEVCFKLNFKLQKW